MSAALTAPFLVAALLLCVAGALKLRSPGRATAALGALGLPAHTWIIRTLAGGELALGALCVLAPTRAGAAVLTGVYVTFAGVAAVLSARRVGCGCFGGYGGSGGHGGSGGLGGSDDEAPVSAVHWIAGGMLAAVAAAAAAVGPRGLGWVLGLGAPTAAVLLVGIAGAVYATVVVYTQLPLAWAAWSGE